MKQTTLTSSPPVAAGPQAPLQYATALIDSMAFKNRKLRTIVTEHMAGPTLNACAGETQLGEYHDDSVYRNDINPDRPDLDSTADVRELDDVYAANQFETIVYDPPWTDHLGASKYDTESPGYTAELMKTFDHLLTDTGTIITVGYTSSVGLLADPSLPYERSHVAIINSFGRMKDPIITVNERVPQSRSSTAPTPPVSTTTSVIMNDTVPHTGRKTQAAPFQLTYRFEPSQPAATKAMQTFIDDHTRGYTLDLYSLQPTTTYEWAFRNAPPQSAHETINIPTYETEVKPHFAFDPTNIDRDLSMWGFGTMILNPPSDEFFLAFGPDGEQGLDRLVKEALNPQLTDDGRVIQVGPTTTLMPNDDAMDDGLPYTRIATGVFSHPGATQDTYITVDEVDASRVATDTGPRWGEPAFGSTGPTQVRCIHCRQTWYFEQYPAVADADCPQCGAHQGRSFCTEAVNGTIIPANWQTPREGLHTERENWARDSLDAMDCPNHDHGHVVMGCASWAPFSP